MKLAAAPVPGDTIFWIVVAVAGALQWLVKRAAASRNNAGDRGMPPGKTRAEVARESETERIRKFLEALGQPPGAPPPRKVAPRPVQSAEQGPARSAADSVKRARTIIQPLPPLTTVPPPEPVRQPKQRVFVPKTPADTQRVQRSIRTQVENTANFAAASSDTTDVRLLLRTNGGLRAMIAAREILGRPRALQPLPEL